ncbi:hypothetical protein ACLUWO_06630 [Pseudoscardovia radai]|uniref:hypothetical protein n=1 Tax=Pseudoscardovia radai TaxID=987066 RepID=UPI0039915B17
MPSRHAFNDASPNCVRNTPCVSHGIALPTKESATPPASRMRESTSRYDAPAGACAFARWYKASSFSESYPLSFASPHVGT